MTPEKPIIMYDSPEAAEIQTLTGWVSKGETPNHIRFWGKDEHMARWIGCTHIKCECGHVHEKTWTMCPECRQKKATERYEALPFKEWDMVEPVVDWDGDRYFFSPDDLVEYMNENEMEDIDLLICDPVNYHYLDSGYWGENMHEDWEPPKELADKIKEINSIIKNLSPTSWMPGKVRTSFKLSEDEKEF